MKYFLKIQLLSDSTFGSGDGVAGLIDEELEHDRFGFPYVRGRTLKGLLSEECDGIVASIPLNTDLPKTRDNLFGRSGSGLSSQGYLYVGDGVFPKDLRNAVANSIEKKQLSKIDILNSLTTIRRQTAISEQTGAPDPGSLRSARLVNHDHTLFAELDITHGADTPLALALLGASSLALRYMGSNRNRGRGHVRCWLLDANKRDLSDSNLQLLSQETNAEQGVTA